MTLTKLDTVPGKKEVATIVLGVCSPDMQFIYILPGWEGSAADSRVLRDAIARRNGLHFPRGKHINYKFKTNFYNYKHSSARNVIERCFGLPKGRWTILRGKSFYLEIEKPNQLDIKQQF
ncbi:uncharacterized protein LOC144547750 [Carex rostrata]